MRGTVECADKEEKLQLPTIKFPRRSHCGRSACWLTKQLVVDGAINSSARVAEELLKS